MVCNVKWKPLKLNLQKKFGIYTESLLEQLVNLFERNTPTCQLRSNNCFSQIRPRMEYSRPSIRFRGSSVWRVPPRDKKSKNYKSFKINQEQVAVKKMDTINFNKRCVASVCILRVQLFSNTYKRMLFLFLS